MKIPNTLYRLINILLPAQSDKKLKSDAFDYWSSSASSNDIQDLSHWRGIGRWDDANWQEIGNRHLAMFEQLYLLGKTRPETIQSMVEWGPGGGANAAKFSPLVNNLWGIDISQSNLEECARQVRSIQDNFAPVLIEANNPTSCLEKIDLPVDFFLSTAVFQHFPSKEYGLEILKLANRMLKTQGLALIQIRYDNYRFKYIPKKRDYFRHAVTFTSYKLDEFWEACRQAGLEPLALSLKPEVNYAYFFLKKPSLSLPTR